MLQNAYSPLTPSNPDVSDRPTPVSTAPTAVKPFSTTAYAERLMDDLFQDVEELLDLAPTPKSSLSAQPDAPSDLPPEPVQDVAQPFPAIEVRSGTEPSLVLAPLPAFGELKSLEDEAPAPEPTPASETAVAVSTLQAAQRQLDRLMIAVGCISVVASLALWLLYQEGRQRQMGAVPGTIASAPVVSAADIEFSRYLQKSLEQIDAATQKSDTVLLPGAEQARDRAANGTTINESLPTVTIPKANLPGLPQSSTTAPTTSPSPATNSATATNPKLPTNLYPPGSKIAPLPNASGKKPAAKPNTPAQASAKPESTLPTIGIPRKLVGVLDQGEQSVALFEINGITQRYELGESIASSGWTLVEVSKNQAVIRRNGEVRSLFVGHSF